MSSDGTGDTFPQQASACRKGGYIVINGRPCKIIEMSTSKTGKHGHAKVRFVALDIFTGKKMEMIESSTHNVMIPRVTRVEYQLVDIDDGYLVLMAESGEMKEDVALPNNELGEQIREAFENGRELNVTIQSAMGEEAPTDFKDAKN